MKYLSRFFFQRFLNLSNKWTKIYWLRLGAWFDRIHTNTHTNASGGSKYWFANRMKNSFEINNNIVYKCTVIGSLFSSSYIKISNTTTIDIRQEVNSIVKKNELTFFSLSLSLFFFFLTLTLKISVFKCSNNDNIDHCVILALSPLLHTYAHLHFIHMG